MRASTVLLTTVAAAVSAQNLQDVDLASFSDALASITADPQYSSLIASIATANPTSLYAEANSYANSALVELSQEAATATGSEAAILSGLYTSVQAGLSSANAYATSALSITGGASGTDSNGAQQTGSSTTGGSGSNSNSGSDSNDSSASDSASAGVESQSGNGAAATAVPIALGAVGMAVLGML